MKKQDKQQEFKAVEPISCSHLHTESARYTVTRFSDGRVVLDLGHSKVVQMPPEYPRHIATRTEHVMRELKFICSDVCDTLRRFSGT